MIKVSGMTPMTTLDYPGFLSAVLYCQGCPFRCAYCHNPTLRDAKSQGIYVWQDIEAFLKKRIGLLDAVVFSGGEPLVQRDLSLAVLKVKEMGYKVGLHTTGIYSERLRKLLPYLDWVGLDIKAPFDEYESITKVPESGERAKQSARYILESGVAYDFRTTFHSKLLPHCKLLDIADELSALGVKKYTVQTFRDEGCVDSRLSVKNNEPIHPGLISELSLRFNEFYIRE